MLQIKKEDFLLFPIVFFWILVFLPKYVQLVFFCLYFTVLASQYGRKKKYDTFFLLQMIYLVIFGISILFNGFIGSHETVRIFAALNTWVINCIAVGSYAIYKSENVISSNKVSKYCFINLVILITLNLIYQLSASAKNVSILGHTLCGADWVEGVYTTRFYGFLDYANMVVFTVLFFYPLALKRINKNKIVKLLITIGSFVTIYTTNSRSGLVLFLVITVLYIFVGRNDKIFSFLKRNKKSLIAFFITAIAILAVPGTRYISGYFDKLMNMRVASNGMRSYIYTSSITRMLRENPFIGIGIKDMIAQYGYPYGSHSTYIGVFYKTGIAGGLIYILSILYISTKTLKSKSKTNLHFLFKVSIVCALILMCVEDIDGTNWAIFLMYFLLSQLRGESQNEYESNYNNNLL
jgi:hypothetical protein